MLARIQERIMVTNWSVLPAPVWALVASPLLAWAGIRAPNGRLFNYPRGCSTSPFNRSFWCVLYAGCRNDGSLWFTSNGTPRAFKPSQYPNILSTVLNRSMFAPSRSMARPLKLWERVLLALGF